MSIEALMDLRKRVDEMLLERRAELQKQLESMDRAIAVVGGGGGSVLKGRKVPPKYRGPSGELGLAEGRDLVGLLLRKGPPLKGPRMRDVGAARPSNRSRASSNGLSYEMRGFAAEIQKIGCQRLRDASLILGDVACISASSEYPTESGLPG